MIKRILEYLGFCQHRWEVLEKVKISYWNNISEIIFVQKCTKCGKLRQFRVK